MLGDGQVGAENSEKAASSARESLLSSCPQSGSRENIEPIGSSSPEHSYPGGGASYSRRRLRAIHVT